MAKLFKNARQKYIKRASGTGFWPVGCERIFPNHSLPQPEWKIENKNGVLRQIFLDDGDLGYLNNETTYRQYAWEFLRRNLFYQKMVDEQPIKSLDEWGYRPDVADEAHAGINEPYTPYCNQSISTSQWMPLCNLQLLAKETVATSDRVPHSLAISNVKRQFILPIELTPDFGPGCLGLETRFAIFKAEIEKYLKKIKEPIVPVKPSKASLRKMLAIADILTHPINPLLPREKCTWYSPKGLAKTLEDANIFLADKDASKNSLTASARSQIRVHRLVSDAWSYIYQWKCLNLLTFDPPERRPPGRPKRPGKPVRKPKPVKKDTDSLTID